MADGQDEFDAFLAKYGLTRNKDTLVENEIDSVELVLGLTKDLMTEMGLKTGAIVKIQKAQREYAVPESGPGSAVGNYYPFSDTQTITSAGDYPAGSIVEEPVVPAWEGDHQYKKATFADSWVCTAGFKQHDVFISYRVASEELAAVTLHSTLAARKRGDSREFHVFLDKRCLVNGESWEEGFQNGLIHSNVVVLLLSEKALERTKTAHLRPDNMFLEIELALKRMKESENSSSPVVVLPIFIWSEVKVGDETFKRQFMPNPRDFPEAYPLIKSGHKKRDADAFTIRQAIEAVLKLQALFAADTDALTKLAPHIFQLVARTQVASKNNSHYSIQRSIILTAAEIAKLKFLLDPIEYEQDVKSLDDVYVEGTRTWLFSQVSEWVDQIQNNDRVLWVNAVGGVGKSVAAAQIARILLESDQLVTALFMKYNDVRRNSARSILTTIAYGLCRWYAPIGRRLLSSGVKKEDLDKMSVPDLFKKLIEDPLGALDEYRPSGAIVVMVDGLDECHPRSEVLRLLAWRLTHLKSHLGIKLLLTSRPEQDIKESFHGVPTKTIEPSSEDNIRDLQIYIHYRLKKYPGLTEEDRKQAAAILLSEGKTFVWINLILNTIEQELEAAEPKRTSLSKVKEVSDSSMDLKGLYQKTFTKIYRQSRFKTELVTVIAALATAQSILTPRIIADVFGFDLDVVRGCLQSLVVVLDRSANGLVSQDGQSSDDAEIKFNHKSVVDYVLSDESVDEPFHVSSRFHLWFARGCLSVIVREEPVINICGIYAFHNDIADLESVVNDKISSSLRYSVAHWISHFVWCLEEQTRSAASSDLNQEQLWSEYQTNGLVDPDLSLSLLSRLLSTHVFFWLECGSLTRVVKQIINQLTVLRRALATAPDSIVDSNTKTLVSDAYRFVREFADPIIASAPQVYNSGYAFTPKQTLLYKTYAGRLEDAIPFLAISGTSATWDPCVMTLAGHNGGVTSVAVSRNGSTVVTGSGDSTIRVWDFATGQHDQTLRDHTSYVNSVAVSADGKLAVSASFDNTIKVWDVLTGQVRHTLKEHTNWVRSVALSQDEQTIVSGSDDNTVKVWSAVTGEMLHSLEGHTGQVISVAISPDGTTIISGSYDQTVRLWDAASGQLKHTLEGHTNSVRSVAISPDGNTVVSGADDATVKIWDAAGGQLQHTINGHSKPVYSVALSLDGKLLASGSSDSTIKLWELSSGQLKQTLEGHTNWVIALAFSSSGKTLVSGSSDRTAKVWEFAENLAKDESSGHTSYVTSVSLSPDGKTILSRDLDDTSITWDLSNGSLVRSPQPFVQLAAVDPTKPGNDPWINIEEAPSAHWLQHGEHIIKVPDSLFVWYDREVSALGSVYMVHRRPVIISPIYLNSPATQYWVGCYNDSFWDVYSEDNFADPSYFVSIDRRAKAFSAFKQSAESGFVSSQFNLGLYYENGIGTEVNLEQALYWYSKASDHGHSESQRRLFVLSSTNAVSNSAEAQFLLGRCFEEGFGTSVDIKAALHRYRNASSHGHAQAKIAIFKLVARAAQDGATTRVPYLGWCYEHGAGVQKDGQEAFWVYKCGAEEEDVESLFQLARCYEKGIGTTIHRERAIGFYQKAASHKHEQATQALKRLDPTGSRRTMRKLGTMLNLLPSK